MSLTTKAEPMAITLCAPCAGILRLNPPRELCGELEVFDDDEVIASIGGDSVRAPGRGFISHILVSDGAHIDIGEPLIDFRQV